MRSMIAARIFPKAKGVGAESFTPICSAMMEAGHRISMGNSTNTGPDGAGQAASNETTSKQTCQRTWGWHSSSSAGETTLKSRSCSGVHCLSVV